MTAPTPAGPAVERHLRSITERDLDTFAATIADDVTVVLGTGTVVTGRAAVLDLHRAWFDDPDWRWTTSSVSETTVGDTHVVLLRVDYQDVDGTGEPTCDEYLLGLTFVRTDGTWLLLHDQNTFF